MADFMPQALPPINAAGMSGMMPFISPDQVAQNQTDMLQWQQRQALAQQLMGAQYQPNSGKVGLGGTILEKVMGALAQNQQNSKLSDILKQQFNIENQAARAKHAQDIQDEYRKLQEKIFETQQGEKAKRDYAPLQFQASGSFDPSTGAYTPSAGAAQQEIGIKAAEAKATAQAQASVAGAAGAAGLNQIKQIMAMPDSPVKQAMLTKALGEGGMQSLQMSNMFGGGAGGGQGGTVQSGPTGEDFLKGLPPAIAGQVKAISEGRQAPPTSMALRSPMGQQLMAAVSQYDPTFDATNYAARAKTRNDFTSGKAGQSVNAMNTAIGHAGTLLDAADALNNTSFPMLNSALNAGAQAVGDPRINQFNTARNALAGELTKAFRGSSGSEKDIQEVQQNLSAAGSPEQMKAAIGQAMKLLASKKESLADQYSKGFGTNSQPNFLDPHAQSALDKLQKGGIDVGALAGDEGLPSGAAAQAAPTATATGPNGQKIGLVNGQWVPL